MKTITLILAMVFAPAVFAAIDTTEYTCQEVRDIARRNAPNSVTMHFGGVASYQVYSNFPGAASCGFDDDREVQVFGPTADAERCSVGFICDQKGLAFDYPGALLVIE